MFVLGDGLMKTEKEIRQAFNRMKKIFARTNRVLRGGPDGLMEKSSGDIMLVMETGEKLDHIEEQIQDIVPTIAWLLDERQNPNHKQGELTHDEWLTKQEDYLDDLDTKLGLPELSDAEAEKVTA